MTRSPYRSLRTAVVSGGLTVAFSSVALAQDSAVPPPATESAPSVPPSVTTAPVETTPATPLPAPSAPSVVVVGPSPAAPETLSTPDKTVAPAEEAEAEEDKAWYEDFTLGVFVDAYGAIRSDSNAKRPDPPPGTAIPGQYPHEAYVKADGFALAFAGLDAAYAGDQFGATLSLRFGPGVNRFFFADNGPLGIDNVTQAFATWKPTDKLTFDVGQFYTLFGAEVTESWRNLNYSRGALYYAMQPFWHTGLRTNIKLHDSFQLNAMIVDGVNTAYENNKSPTVGVQGILTASDSLTLAAGYMGALNPRDGGEAASRFDHFFDVVATLTLGDFKVVGNFDYNLYEDTGADKENWWGISIAPGYTFNDYFGAALRAEYLSDSANFLFGMVGSDGETPVSDAGLTTLTATLDIKPVPGSTALVLRPEFRYEIASDDYFLDDEGALTDKFWTVMMGVVVTSMP